MALSNDASGTSSPAVLALLRAMSCQPNMLMSACLLSGLKMPPVGIPPGPVRILHGDDVLHGPRERLAQRAVFRHAVRFAQMAMVAIP